MINSQEGLAKPSLPEMPKNDKIRGLSKLPTVVVTQRSSLGHASAKLKGEQITQVSLVSILVSTIR